MNAQQSYLYKYRTIDSAKPERAERIFTHNEVYFSSAKDFNDPFDCKFQLSHDASPQQIKKYMKSLVREKNPNFNRAQRQAWIKRLSRKAHDPDVWQEITKGVDKIISQLGIYSLTRAPDDILMWSHYAASHTGFCLQFNDDPNNPFIGRAQPVIYSGEYPVVNPFTQDYTVRMEKSVLTKADHWSYEQEWRIIDHNDGPGLKYFPAMLLVGVIFGYRMSSEHKALIRKWCEGRSPLPVFYQASLKSGRYGVDIKPL
jgi:hypothetical protein